MSLMIVISIIETYLPGQKSTANRRQHIPPNLALMVVTFWLGTALNVGAVAVASLVNLNGYSIIELNLPYWLVVVLSIACLDFCAYWAHRLMHLLPFMWRVHRVHHTDLLIDVTTAYRQHPMEGLWRFAFTIIPAWFLGIPVEVIVMYKMLSALFAILEHMNVELWHPLDRLINKILVTPNMHKIHHSRRQIETDSNYGNVLSVYDRLHRTFTEQKDLSTIHYGLDQLGSPKVLKFTGLLRLPFANEGLHK